MKLCPTEYDTSSDYCILRLPKFLVISPISSVIRIVSSATPNSEIRYVCEYISHLHIQNMRYCLGEESLLVHIVTANDDMSKLTSTNTTVRLGVKVEVKKAKC